MKSSLVQLNRYWHIVLFKTYANLKRDIDNTHVGTLWWVLEPMLQTAVTYFIFTYVFSTRTPNFLVFLFVGNVVYNHFSASINGGANAIVAAGSLMQQIQLPKSLYPIIAICNLTWKFLFSVIIVFPLLWICHFPVSLPYLALPVLIVLQLFVVVSLSLPLSILMPYFQDGKTLLTTLLVLVFWLSGVFYRMDNLPAAFPDWLRPWLYWNPAVSLIEGYRSVLMDAAWPIWSHFVPGLLVCTASMALGFWLTNKLGGKVTKLAL